MSKFQNGDIVVVRQDCGQRVKYRINGMEFVLGLRDKVQVMWYVNSTRVLVDGEEQGFDYPVAIEEELLEKWNDEKPPVVEHLGLDVRKGDVTYGRWQSGACSPSVDELGFEAQYRAGVEASAYRLRREEQVYRGFQEVR